MLKERMKKFSKENHFTGEETEAQWVIDLPRVLLNPRPEVAEFLASLLPMALQNSISETLGIVPASP